MRRQTFEYVEIFYNLVQRLSSLGSSMKRASGHGKAQRAAPATNFTVKALLLSLAGFLLLRFIRECFAASKRLVSQRKRDWDLGGLGDRCVRQSAI